MKALRVAIPVFNGRISPLLDVAVSFVTADIDRDEIREKSVIKLADNSSLLRLGVLKKQGVALVICSAVSRECACAVARMGITVLPGIIGEVDDVIEAFARDALGSERFAMPGCCGRSRRRPWGCAAADGSDESINDKGVGKQ